MLGKYDRTGILKGGFMKKVWLGLFILLLTCNVYAADQWDRLDPAGTESPSDLDALIITNNNATDRLLYNYRQGCKITYSSASSIIVESGELALPNAAGTVVKWRRNPTNTTVTWADIDTGSEAASTTYYLYGLADADATTFTVKISASSTAPSGGTNYRKLGSFYNDASSNIGGIKDEGTTQFGSWASKSSGVTYLAPSDGFVLGTAYTGGLTGNVDCYTDSSSTPTTRRQYVTRTPQITDEWYSYCMPVKSGDYWKVTVSLWTTTPYFLPKE